LVDGRARVLEINACVRLGAALLLITDVERPARQGELIALLAKLG
jgi:hypothetical protein